MARIRSIEKKKELLIVSKISKPVAFALLLIILDAILVSFIVSFVPYTKIDWDAYMSQVDGFIGGERDYSKLKGDTGPLVYPAGFLYVYSAIKFITGGHVFPAQVLFGLLYMINLGIILFIYIKADLKLCIWGIVSLDFFTSVPLPSWQQDVTRQVESNFNEIVASLMTKLPWWALSLLCLSKRIHSIFMLRLFNDCFAMTLLHAALALLLYQKWHLALIIFSGAVSIKMNVLLFAPPLFLLMLKAMSLKGLLSALLGAGLLQILLGLPFFLSHPVAYISRAFNLGRVFIHFWSVNFKFVPEGMFVSKGFASALLALHLALLLLFAHCKWSKHEGGVVHLLHTRLHNFVADSFSIHRFLSSESSFRTLNKEHIITVMFVGNFIGIVCARSLHYQFYSWYFFSLPFLLWKTPFPTPLRLILFAGVELCWNIYPSTVYSSMLLLCIHLSILWGLWVAPSEYPYLDPEQARRKDK